MTDFDSKYKSVIRKSWEKCIIGMLRNFSFSKTMETDTEL